MMGCPICNGKKTIWHGAEQTGIFICRPCPVCNNKNLTNEKVLLKSVLVLDKGK
ncbi:hypothetical protein IGI80_000329 [Enterococcus sp. DIV1420a]